MKTEIAGLADCLWAGAPVAPEVFSAIRRRVQLEGCKWDVQVGDVSALAAFPIVMKRSEWCWLATQAEKLAAELMEVEREIVGRPELLGMLGLPASLEKLLADGAQLTPSNARVIRFDFHLTDEGWRVSEANTDVPGGFSEASFFTQMMAEQCPDLQTAGNPVEAWTEALLNMVGEGSTVVLLSAAGYLEDHQVTAYLSAKLRERGCRTYLAQPCQIYWRNGVAHVDTAWYRGPVDGIVRFYQAEWLARLPEHTGWKFFFKGGKTPVANTALAIISESKRFPLAWPHLMTELPTWRALLPETKSPRLAEWSDDDDMVFKTALCNTGDAVCLRDLMNTRDWWMTRLKARLFSHTWIAQKRFCSIPVLTPIGPRHVCVGVYTVNGKAAGAYVRLARKPLIDFAAEDAALLLEENE